MYLLLQKFFESDEPGPLNVFEFYLIAPLYILEGTLHLELFGDRFDHPHSDNSQQVDNIHRSYQ